MSAEPEFDDVIEALGACQVLDAPEELQPRVKAAALEPGVPTAYVDVYDAYRDDAYSLLIRLLLSEELARDALEDAFFRLQREDHEAGVTWPLALRAVCDAGRDALRLLRKTGRLQEQTPILGALDGDAQLMLLLRREFGLSELELARALESKTPELDLRAAAAAFAGELKTPSHEGGELAKDRIVRSALGLLEEGEAEALSAHDCPSCDLLAARLEEELSLPALHLPRAEEIASAIAARAEKDREHQRAVAFVQTKVSLNCTYCHSAMQRAETAFCATCLAPHHGDCFAEHGTCSAPGCAETSWVHPSGTRGAPEPKTETAAADRGGLTGPPRRSPWRSPIVLGALAASACAIAVAGYASFQNEQRVRELNHAQRAALDALRAKLAAETERREDTEELEARLELERLRAEEKQAFEAVRRERALKLLSELDQVVLILRNGRQLKGVLRKETEDKVVLRMQGGTITVPRAEVKEIQRVPFDREDALAIIIELQEEQQRLVREKQELESRMSASEALIAKMRSEFKTDDSAMSREIEAAFAKIETLAKERRVEELIAQFTALRALMNRYGAKGTEEVKANMARYNARLQQFGEIQLSIQLQIYINQGNQTLRRLAELAPKDPYPHAEVRSTFAALDDLCEEMRSESREVFARNADSLWQRGRALALQLGAKAVTVDHVSPDRTQIISAEDATSYQLATKGSKAQLLQLARLAEGRPVLLFFENREAKGPVRAVYGDVPPSKRTDVVLDEEVDVTQDDGAEAQPDAPPGGPLEHPETFLRVDAVTGIGRVLNTESGNVYRLRVELYERKKELLVRLKRGQRITVREKGGTVIDIELGWKQ